MKDASQYPIKLGFGATSYPYSPTNPHQGIDRGCEVGTPVVVSGVTIGLSGNTGYSLGPHLHYALFREGKQPNGIYDSKQNRTYFNPTDAFTITGTVIFAQNNSTAGNEVIIHADNGNFYRYLHLSEIKVTKGQVIGMTDKAIKYAFKAMVDREPTSGDYEYWRVRTPEQLNETLYNSKENDAMRKAYRSPQEYEPITETLYRGKGQR